MPLELYAYKDGDIDRLPPLVSSGSNGVMVPEQSLEPNEVTVPKPKYSEFTMAVEEGLKVNDPNNFLEVTTKEGRKQMIEFINTYNPLLEAAEEKAKGIASEMEAE
jgi:hypothetical protein